MPAAHTFPSPIFSVRELVICMIGNCPYEARIVSIKEHRNVLKYFVQKCRMSKNPGILVAVGEEEGRLFRGFVANCVEKNRAAAADQSSPSDSDDGEGVTVNFHWRFDFPTNLQELCIEDRARIHLGQLTRLPSAVTIDAIMDKYEKSLRSNFDALGSSEDAEKAEIQLIAMNGMRNFFNKALHLQLLYTAELEQYHEASQVPGFSASANYGVVHFLRAFTNLAKTIKRAKIQSPFAEGLVANSKLFLEFISQNLESLGVEYYEKADQEEEA